MTSCREEFADVNINKQAVVTGNLSFLMAEAVNRFDPQAYLEYYYNAPMKYNWSGMGISPSGASEGILTMTATGDQGSQYVNVLRVVRAMENEFQALDEKGQAAGEAYVAAARVLAIYLGIYDTDMYGSIPYVEACNAAYGGTLTPAYDTVESLYSIWLSELDESIASLTKSTATMASAQDVVYGGDCAKWAKFANSLKLRIAVRLLNADAGKAQQIASQVASASCGYIDSVDDAVLFNKGNSKLTGDGGYLEDRMYHWNNGFTGTAGRESVINFMVENQDPRVRFFYNKNQWNSKIVQAFYDAGLEIPEFIEKNVVSEVVNGKKTFVKWGGLGEPWVRYYGMTEDWNAGVNLDPAHKWWFPTTYGKGSTECQIRKADGSNPTAYTAYSTLNQMMIIGRSYSAASQVSASTTPDDTYTFNTDNRPWFGMYLSAGEVNLYLAEFAMLNGQEAQAEAYYKKALQFSVQEYGKLAEKNQIAYHSSVQGCFGYDPNEGAIDLKDGEIATMLASTAGYDFSGSASEKLEKIYLQELIHFTLYPNEVYVTARRSGYPKYNSTILPRANYAEVPATAIPRRFPTGAVTDDDLTADQRKSAYAAQGLSITSDGSYDAKLASERLWQDKNAPAWGAGK